MDPRFTAGAARLAAALGESAIYTVKTTTDDIPVVVMIERDVIAPVPTMSSYIAERRTIISIESRVFTTAEITPALGDTITVGTEYTDPILGLIEPDVFTVLSIEQDDGYITRLRVRT